MAKAVYFIRTQDAPYVKIGEGNAACRLRDCQTGNPYKLILWFSYTPPKCFSVRKVEKRLHRKFAEHRAGGGSEWFRLTPELEAKLLSYRANPSQITDDVGMYRMVVEPGHIELTGSSVAGPATHHTLSVEPGSYEPEEFSQSLSFMQSQLKAGNYKMENELGLPLNSAPWLLLLKCQHGDIYPHSPTHLGFASFKNGSIVNRVSMLDGAVVVQAGDDGSNIIFPIDKFDTVAQIVKPRKQKRLSREQRDECTARLAEYSFQSCT